MNIILTVNYSPWSKYAGGGQNSTHNLATTLTQRGHDIIVIYTKPPWEKVPVPKNIPYSIQWAFFFGIRSSVNAFLRPFNALSVAYTVKKILKHKTISAVHSQGEEGALISLLKKKHAFRFIVTPRYPSYPDCLFRKSTFFEKILLYTSKAKYTALKHALQGADYCCPTSNSSRKHIIDAYSISPDKIIVVPNGISSAFLDIKRKKNALQGPAVFFGRLTSKKGADIFIKALAKLGTAAPQSLIIGRGDEKNSLITLIKELNLTDRVALIDWQSKDELMHTLSGASMAVLPSREESFGNVMVETLAAGVPLITTTVGSIPEIINNEMAILTKPDAVDATAAGIKWVLQNYDKAQRMAQKGKNHIKKNYSWNATAASFEKIYQNSE